MTTTPAPEPDARPDDGDGEAPPAAPGREAEHPSATTPSTVSAEAWEAANSRYLTAALGWLRLLLRRHADTPAAPAGPGRPAAKAAKAAEQPVTEARLATAEEEMAQAGAVDPPPALISLARLLGLSAFERNTLLLCTAPALDPGIAELYARAQGAARTADPTFALALSLFPEPAWDVLSPYRGLRWWQLVEIGRSAGQTLVSSPLRADERIVDHLKGLDYLDERLEPRVTPVAPPTGGAGPSGARHAAVARIAAHWPGGPELPDRRPPVVQLLGADRESKRAVAAQCAAEAGLLLHRLPVGLIPGTAVELDTVARLWQREARLLPLALYLDADDDGIGDGTGGPGEAGPGDERDETRRIGRFLERSGGPCFLATRESRPGVPAPTVAVDVEPPSAAERARAWAPAFEPADADRLAGQFALDLGAIEEIAAATAGDPAAAWQGCLARTRPRLGALAQRLEPRVGWDDIVLPAQELGLIRQIADQVAQRGTVYQNWGFGDRVTRGLGISALFTGPSGTGKTMAAEVLARHLGVDLYRVDLSAAVSKYIGETEKNLRRLFDAAEPGGTILFFDEADALFGKRSQVRDSHDRYANIEVSYLLQRMEAYQGLAILATNLRRSLDTAFLRRLRFVVPFAFPGAGERRAMWARAFPAGAPVGPLDLERLAALPLSGGMIRNTAVNAAFAAASAGTPIGMAAVLAAARAELHKAEMPAAESDFVWDDRTETAV
ncbi:ATP-binding protein [Kitasatospora sp. NBC_01560]|uniref:ATP-binding protein n=1 Tax=Kitasatospora sp. NBC_01560 TaxID=2975965 RepID=UPI00386D8D2B